ncbi:MAG TPA: polysaccharide deacetylase family protein [Natronosporangium sp.]|nr:polysaccharide deacetylase family protein [Natronosporangium sp.]
MTELADTTSGGGWRPIVRRVARRVTAPVGTVRAVRTPSDKFVVTYDDGPDPPGTTAVLSALADHGVTATFFVLMPRARRYPGLLAEIAAAGHEIALHGEDHRRLTQLPAAQVRRRLAAARAELEDLTGAPVRWFRPPYGAQLPRTWLAIRQAGLEPVGWGPTPYDWLHLPEHELAERALSRAAPGEILLAHDAWPGPDVGVDDGPAPPIDRGKLARLMLAGLAERRLVGCSLRDALADGELLRWAWFRR